MNLGVPLHIGSRQFVLPHKKNNGKTLEPRTWFDLARDPIINFGRFFYLFCLVPFVSPPPPNTAYVLYIFVVTACSVTWTLLYRAH